MLFRCFLVSYIYLNIFEEYLEFCAIRSYKSSFFCFSEIIFSSNGQIFVFTCLLFYGLMDTNSML